MKTHAVLLAVLGGLVLAGPAAAQGPFGGPNTNSDFQFAETLTPNGATTALTWDGTNYWTATGGNTGGVRFAQYTAAGSFVNSFSPGIDFRSLTIFSSQIHARGFSSAQMQPMTSPGVFGGGFTLTGGTINSQGDVVFDGANFVSNNNGVINRWTGAGAFNGTVSLAGWGLNGEDTGSDQPFMMSAGGGFWLTYNSTNRDLSAWNTATGVRLGITNLTGAATGDFNTFSFSFANNRAWMNDDVANANALWRGYPVFGSAVPEPTTLALGSLGLAGAAAAGWRRMKKSRHMASAQRLFARRA